MSYGSSPDALEPAVILLEVKTRVEHCSGPSESLDKFPQYFVRCQLQMLFPMLVSVANAFPDANFCILQIYHPETST